MLQAEGQVVGVAAVVELAGRDSPGGSCLLRHGLGYNWTNISLAYAVLTLPDMYNIIPFCSLK